MLLALLMLLVLGIAHVFICSLGDIQVSDLSALGAALATNTVLTNLKYVICMLVFITVSIIYGTAFQSVGPPNQRHISVGSGLGHQQHADMATVSCLLAGFLLVCPLFM